MMQSQIDTLNADVKMRDADIGNLNKIINDLWKEIEGFSMAIENYNRQLTLCNEKEKGMRNEIQLISESNGLLQK